MSRPGINAAKFDIPRKDESPQPLQRTFMLCVLFSCDMYVNSANLFCTRGFWLDIRAGPFITFGVECDDRDKYGHDLLAVVNKGTGGRTQHDAPLPGARIWPLDESLCI